MTRSFFSVLMVTVAVMALSPAFLQGCSQTGVGDPCTPEQEYDPTFLGFSVGEVNVESKSFDCQTRLCLANHFQGRVTCPYGQTKQGQPCAAGSQCLQANTGSPYTDTAGNTIGPCELPFSAPATSNGTIPSGSAITGVAGDTVDGQLVPPQCLDRTGGGTSPTAVYCSCRCENVNGQTNDGAVYCACPQGFTCTQLVSPIGTGDTGLTGGYCILNNTEYNNNSACGEQCSGAKANCGTYDGL
jgi:hypothetical protein